MKELISIGKPNRPREKTIGHYPHLQQWSRCSVVPAKLTPGASPHHHPQCYSLVFAIALLCLCPRMTSPNRGPTHNVPTYSLAICSHLSCLCFQDVVIQDVDEGQPCLSCRDKCLGFTQHAWRSGFNPLMAPCPPDGYNRRFFFSRNVCQHCKCSRETHDVYQADLVDVRDRVGWETADGGLTQERRDLLHKLGYTWVPHGLSPNQVG